MMDRERILQVMRRHFAGSSVVALAEAANAIMGLDEEWEEVPLGTCDLATLVRRGIIEVRIFRRRSLNASPGLGPNWGRPS